METRQVKVEANYKIDDNNRKVKDFLFDVD